MNWSQKSTGQVGQGPVTKASRPEKALNFVRRFLEVN